MARAELYVDQLDGIVEYVSGLMSQIKSLGGGQEEEKDEAGEHGEEGTRTHSHKCFRKRTVDEKRSDYKMVLRGRARKTEEKKDGKTVYQD